MEGASLCHCYNSYEDKRRYKAEANLYTIMKVARDEDLREQIGKDIYFDLVDHDKVRNFRIQKHMPFDLFKEEVAKEFGIPVRFQRFWKWGKRMNQSYRPLKPLTPQEEAQPVGALREVGNKADNSELKLFLEVKHGPDLFLLPPPEKNKEDILLFFKLYDPDKEELRYAGRLFVNSSSKPIEILAKVNEMAGFATEQEIELFEEIRFEPNVMCERLDESYSFRSSQIEDGDIICFQKRPLPESKGQVRFPDVPSFLEYVKNRPVSRFHSYDGWERGLGLEHSDATPQRTYSASQAEAPEILYAEELRRRKESEEALERARKETEKMQREIGGVVEELRVAREQKFSLECQVADSDKMVEELKQKMSSAVELLQMYKKERDVLQVERNNALRVAGELRESQADDATSSSISQLFTEFSFWEIEEATSNFSQSMKIVGEGGYGSVYRGNLRHTQVIVKKLNPDGVQGPSAFQQEVNILSKLRHPNIITLVGACPEAWALIYEYLPNGSLEDRLKCKNNSTPLSWKTRTRIAAELCSALTFLHSCRPQGIIHGYLTPANILLDANLVSKLSDFGICRQLHKDVFSENNTTQSCRTDPKGTFAYLDPEFFATGELTAKSDVYSFGLILLMLLTGEPALGIAKKVECALDNGNLIDLLDPTAGDWPFVQATQLACLALRCSDMNGKDRPDFASEVWRVLEPMRISCGVTSLGFSSEERSHIPAHFVCPIFQEIMQDPVFAADGHTYESEAIKGWLESGHDTSPMTNLKLPHLDLVPNHAVRSAIQEWLQQP